MATGGCSGFSRSRSARGGRRLSRARSGGVIRSWRAWGDGFVLTTVSTRSPARQRRHIKRKRSRLSSPAGGKCKKSCFPVGNKREMRRILWGGTPGSRFRDSCEAQLLVEVEQLSAGSPPLEPSLNREPGPRQERQSAASTTGKRLGVSRCGEAVGGNRGGSPMSRAPEGRAGWQSGGGPSTPGLPAGPPLGHLRGH